MKNVKKIVLAGAFAAAIFIATFLIQITLPGGGYFNLGDCFVVTSGVVLGPLFSFFAAGIGSMLADLFGYAIYVPATFLIKGLMALVVALIYKRSQRITAVMLSAFLAEIIMIFGYYIYECILTSSFIAPLMAIPGNFLQASVGIVSSVALISLIAKNKVIKKFLFE